MNQTANTKKHLTVEEFVDLFTTPEVEVTIYDFAASENVFSGSVESMEFEFLKHEFVESIDSVDREHPRLTINIDSRKHY